MTHHTISNNDDVIDSRNVIERLEELEYEIETALADAEDAPTEPKVWADWAKEHGADEESVDELLALRALAEEGESVAANWAHGETLIRESYFVEYCQELVENIGDLPRDLPSYIEIDWEATANNLRVDYSEVEYAGVTYLIR